MSPIGTEVESEVESEDVVDSNIMHYDKGSQSMCDECGQICDTKRLLTEHRKEHFPAKCTHCDRILSTSEQLDNHLLFHQYSKFVAGNPNKMVYRCSLCEKNCRTEVEFVDHINVHKGKYFFFYVGNPRDLVK